MASKQSLREQIEAVLKDAVRTAADLVEDTLRAELSGVVGGLMDEATEDFPNRPARGKPGRKLAATNPARRQAKAARKASPSGGRRRTLTDDTLDKLVDIVGAAAGEVVPAEARKVLRLTAQQMQTLARAAAQSGRIKVVGAGRGTRYIKA